MIFRDLRFSFESGIGISLELLFADKNSPTNPIGKTFDLFDCDGTAVSGTCETVI